LEEDVDVQPYHHLIIPTAKRGVRGQKYKVFPSYHIRIIIGRIPLEGALSTAVSCFSFFLLTLLSLCRPHISWSLMRSIRSCSTSCTLGIHLILFRRCVYTYCTSPSSIHKKGQVAWYTGFAYPFLSTLPSPLPSITFLDLVDTHSTLAPNVDESLVITPV
jgi:hypothetical protein